MEKVRQGASPYIGRPIRFDQEIAAHRRHDHCQHDNDRDPFETSRPRHRVLQQFQGQRNALPAADAQGDHAFFQAIAPH